VSDPDLTPSEEQVRRLLADARHDDPVPDDVVARLDRALADLQGEARRTPAPADAAPIDLGARRRRRIARNLLVAAAAVVVVGVGISRVDLAGQSDKDASSDSGAASAPQETARDDEAGGDALMVRGRVLVLSSEDFDQQARRARLSRELDSAAAAPLAEGYSSDADMGSAARAWCNDPAWGVGERIPVRYDGRRGVLVLRPASGGSRATDLYLCGETVPTRSTTVPAG
jgi:hypothetical protein